MKHIILITLASLLALSVNGQTAGDGESSLSIVSGRVQPLVHSGEKASIDLVVRNDGQSPVSSVVVTTRSGDDVMTLNHDVAIAPSEEISIAYDYPMQTGQGVENVDLTVTVSDPDAAAGESMAADVLTLKTNVYADDAGFDAPRGILSEYFSTEYCSSCPLRTLLVKEVIDTCTVPVIWVSHHTGYHHDRYTVGYSEEVRDNFYGDELYAPAGMVDRRFFPDMPSLYGHPTETPVFSVNDTYLRRAIERESSIPNLVSIDIATRLDDSGGKLHIAVSGTDLLVTENQRINVFVIEDGLQSMTQSGWEGQWTHDHVLREVLTGYEGMPLEIAPDGSYHFETEWTVKHELQGEYETTLVNLANISVVAFVANMDTSDPNDCYVFNAAIERGAVASSTDGIIAADDVSVRPHDGAITVSGTFDKATVCTPGGTVIASAQPECGVVEFRGLHPGIYLVSVTSADGVRTVKAAVE